MVAVNTEASSDETEYEENYIAPATEPSMTNQCPNLVSVGWMACVLLSIVVLL